MRTGVLSGRSYFLPVSVNTASTAHVLLLLRVITRTALWPFFTTTLLGSNPLSVTATWISDGPEAPQLASNASANNAMILLMSYLLRSWGRIVHPRLFT